MIFIQCYYLVSCICFYFLSVFLSLTLSPFYFLSPSFSPFLSLSSSFLSPSLSPPFFSLPLSVFRKNRINNKRECLLKNKKHCLIFFCPDLKLKAALFVQISRVKLFCLLKIGGVLRLDSNAYQITLNYTFI